MSGSNKTYKLPKIFLIIVLLFSCAVFTYRVYSHYYQMPIDYLIFLKTAKDFQETGKLYQRVENYPEQYGPSAAIYKFPPPFQLAFVPLAKLPQEINQLSLLKPLLIGMYLLSLLLLYRYIAGNYLAAGEQRFYFGALLLITACWFMPFFESIRWLLAEIPILLMFVAGFMLERRGKFTSFFSGMTTAFLACIKIYPVFMAGNLLREKNYSGMGGFIAGAIAIALLSLSIFGLEEHRFYVTRILPILLNEEVSTKWNNLNIEKFIFSLGLITESNGWIFQTTRFITLSAFWVILARHHKQLREHPLLAFSFFICTMFFCFPNYWPQYQIYLIIPVAYLLANYLKNPPKRICAISLGIAILTLFIPHNLWQNPLVSQVFLMPLLSMFLYEARALATVVLWLLIAREIHRLKMPD